jgi:hypothetical protein
MTMHDHAPVSDHEQRLVKLRDLLEASLAEAPAYTRAPLAREYAAVLERLEKLHPAEVSDRVDDLAAARTARRANAKGRAGTG